MRQAFSIIIIIIIIKNLTVLHVLNVCFSGKMEWENDEYDRVGGWMLTHTSSCLVNRRGKMKTISNQKS